jgi:hypothetical protein
MLSKCASPECRNEFRYLHEGKLYLIDSKAAFARREYPGQGKREGKSAVEYVWLCSTCCRDLTIHADPDFGISVVRREIDLISEPFSIRTIAEAR